MAHGGKRRGAGRKSKAEEQALIERLSPLDDTAFSKLEAAMKKGDTWAIKLFFEYRFGKPKQSFEMDSVNDVNINITWKGGSES